MNALIVIPARYASTRFPGKPLADIAGKSLIRRVIERAQTSTMTSAVWVATDDDRILEHVRSFGGRVVMTRRDHESGTDRIAEALHQIEQREGTGFDQIINVQGDEPLIDMSSVDRVIELLQADESVDVATLCCPIGTEDEFRSRDAMSTCKVHFHHRWREHEIRFGLSARESPPHRSGAARGARIPGHDSEVRPYINVDPGTMSPFPARRGLRHRRRRGDRPRPRPLRALRLPTMTGRKNNYTTGRIYRESSRRSGAAITSARPFRSFRTSPTRSRSASARSPDGVRTWSSSRSAARSATSSLSPSSRRSASSAGGGRGNAINVHLTLVPYIRPPTS
jgi:spore coat polysaccharide biosynthesis protein SpsF (cytidylyltransferase family)